MLKNAAEFRAAIMRRHTTTGVEPAQLLDTLLADLTVLVRQDKLDGQEAQEIRNKIMHARQMDKAGTL